MICFAIGIILGMGITRMVYHMKKTPIYTIEDLNDSYERGYEKGELEPSQYYMRNPYL